MIKEKTKQDVSASEFATSIIVVPRPRLPVWVHVLPFGASSKINTLSSLLRNAFGIYQDQSEDETR